MRAVVDEGSVVALASDRVSGVVERRRLLELLRQPGRVTLLSAPAGSGKTVLLRSWLDEIAVTDSVAWISVDRDERDPQRFWISVLDALRDTAAGSELVPALTAAPGLDGGAIVERLLEALDALPGRLWLVINDLHELRSDEALRQLELLMMRSRAELRFVLATRHDPRLGLHRFRLRGELTEIRADDLRFTLDEARALFEASGVPVLDSALELLHSRTEGWAAGLRLAALSLAGHPDPDRFAAEFSGSERMVAEYLMAEVLEQQPDDVRRLLLRTSILERVNGPLADLLTGGSGSERIIHDLEQANAFVVSLDPARSWFRYRYLFADLLTLELRRTEPGGLSALHRTAADWFARHGYVLEAVRHAEAAEDWQLASHLLCDNWISIRLDGQQDAAHELLNAFPTHIVRGDPELASLRAAGQLIRGSLDVAERYLEAAARASASVSPERAERFQLSLATRRLRVARRRGNLPVVVEEAQRLLAPAEAPDAARLGLGEEIRAVALIELGIAELWSGRHEHMDRHFEQGIALARRIERPYLEVSALAHWAMAAGISSSALAVERGRQAIELARRHGWSDESVVAVAYLALSTVDLWQGRLEEAEAWLQQAERTLQAETEPAAGTILGYNRGLLELARGRNENALDAFQAAQRRTALLAEPHSLATRMQAQRLHAMLRTGDVESVEKAVSQMDEGELDSGDMRTTLAALRLGQADPEAATVAIAPVLDGSALVPTGQIWLVQALLLEAIARDALGDAGAANNALKRALDLAEPEGAVLPFLLHPAPALLDGHCRHRTTHAALICEILNLLAGRRPASPAGGAEPLQEPLSESETRVLRYLPTNLSLREIGDELYVSVHTVKTHIKHLYVKLGVHSRGEAVDRARVLGLLAPSSRRY